MKKLSGLLIFLFCALYAFPQYPNNQSISNNQTRYHIPVAKIDSSLILSVKDTLNNQSTFYPGALTVRPQDTIGHATFPIYQSNGRYWSKVATTFLVSQFVDSITLYNGQLCQWVKDTATCWFLDPSTGGDADSLHLNYDSLWILHYRNGALRPDSIFLLHTYLYVNPAHFSLTKNYLGDPYTELLNATFLVDSVYASPFGSGYNYYRYANGQIDSLPAGAISPSTVQWSVLDSLSTPAVLPREGSIYLVGTSPTGQFVGHANQIATRDSVAGTYSFQTAAAGDLLYNVATGIVSQLISGTWVRVGRLVIHQGGDTYITPISIGPKDNYNLEFIQNNTRRMYIDASDKYLKLTGTTGIGLLTGDATQKLYFGDPFNSIYGDGASYIEHDAYSGRWRFKGTATSTTQVLFQEFGNSFLYNTAVGKIGVADTSSIFEASSPTKGALLPRMTAVNRIALGSNVKGGAITAAGSGYTTSFYSGVALNGGSGTGAKANITVTAGAVTGVELTNGGKNFVVNDVLSSAVIGGGSGFTYRVDSVGTLGMIVYDLDSNSYFQYNRTAWQNLYNVVGGGVSTLQQVLDAESANAQLNKDDTITANGNVLFMGDLFGGLYNGLQITSTGTGIGTAYSSSGNSSQIHGNSDGSGASFQVNATNNSGGFQYADISGYSDPSSSSLNYTALQHNINGLIKASSYGSGAITGTPTYNLSVDATGNIIETATGGGGGIDLANFYLKDSSLSSNRTVDLNGFSLDISDATGLEFFIDNPDGAITAITPLGKMMQISDDNGVAKLQYDGSNKLEITSTGTAITGNLTLITPPSGASTDSILTQDAATGIVKRRTVSSFGFALADSTVWQTKYRSDTARTNTYTSLAGKESLLTFGLGLNRTVNTVIVDTSSASILSRQRAAATYAPIGNYAIGDSTLWQTKYRSDTGRVNVYTSLAGKLTTVGDTTKLPFTMIDYFGKTITYFGNSIVFGVGAADTAHRWTTLLSKYLGAIEDNRGLSSTVLEKRTPIDPYSVSPNMVDNLATVPTKTNSKALLVIAYGINDVGWASGANYNPTNFALDYDSILTYCINTKGWNKENILLIAPWYVDYAGYQQYAGYPGNTAPNLARHRSFIAATQTTAQKWGTLYINPYNAMANNGDSSLLVSGNGLHPNDAGHAFIANLVGQYLSGTQAKTGFKQFTRTTTSNTGVLVDSVISTTTTTGQAINVTAVGASSLSAITSGSTVSGSLLGATLASSSMLSAAGGQMAVGTTGNFPLILSTNNTARVTVSGAGGTLFTDSIGVWKAQNLATIIRVNNSTSGTAAQAQFVAANSGSGSWVMGKFSPTTSTLQNIGANDAYLYNSSTAGNISVHNANTSGNINFAAGGSSTAQFTIASTGAATFTGAITATTYNGNTLTTGSSTYTGTAAQTYTFPTTTATIARTDAGQTFTGNQVFTSILTANGGIQTAGTTTNSNLYAVAASVGTGVLASNSTAAYMVGANNTQFRVGVRGSTATVATAGTDVWGLLVGNNTFTEATSGTSALAGGVGILTQTFTNGSGATTDFQNLYVGDAPTGATNNWAINTGAVFNRTKESFNSTITAGGTTGNQTINTPTGTVNIAAAGTTVTVTNSLVTTSSIVYCVIRTNDATATGIKSVVPASGSFVITLNAATTAEVSIGFIVFN